MDNKEPKTLIERCESLGLGNGNLLAWVDRVEAQQAEIERLTHARDVLHDSYIRHLEELDLVNQQLVAEESANSLNNSVISTLRQQLSAAQASEAELLKALEWIVKNGPYVGWGVRDVAQNAIAAHKAPSAP